ncbi:MAG TPA: isocitrate dehydrogenase kinase/phosphatase AceK regulatory subunit [Steroidobacteraceae bacterium]
MTARTARRIAIRLRERRDTLPLAIAREIFASVDKQIEEAVRSLLDRFPEAEVDESLWPAIKLAYLALLREHQESGRAAAFYDCVACAVLHPRHHHDEFIFRRG